MVETKDETENNAPEDEVEGGGRACRQKGWWKRGDVEGKLNTVNMTAWVHKECNGIEEEAITKLQEAWDSSEQKEVVLCNKIKQFQSKLLRKWVQGLGTEQRAAAFMKDASAANKHTCRSRTRVHTPRG